jgi:hypothetical protein
VSYANNSLFHDQEFPISTVSSSEIKDFEGHPAESLISGSRALDGEVTIGEAQTPLTGEQPELDTAGLARDVGPSADLRTC